MKLEFSVHASKLKNVAGALKGTSDPFCVVTLVASKPGEKPVVLGKTEVIKNTLSPDWVKNFIIDYELGVPTLVAVQIFDEVRKGENKSMGSATFDIGNLLGARGNMKAKKLKKGGTIFAHVSKCQGSGILRLRMKGIKLKNTEGFLRKSDPFFELSKKRDSAGGQTWDNVHRSETVMDNLSPSWKEAVVELSTLCDGDLDKPVQVTVYDYESSGKHVLMGAFETTVNGLVRSATGGSEDPSKAFIMKRKGKETGKVVVLQADVSGVKGATEQMAKMTVSPPPVAARPAATKAAAPAFVPSAGSPTFVDYVSGGCEIQCTVAIDFTGSNGDPRKPGTLHYLHKDGKKNDYERAISAILKILSKYDSDQKFPVLGFGAKYGGVVRHAFQCGPAAEADGIEGVLNAYHQVFRSGLVMSGPTVFTEVMQMAAAQAVSAQEAAKAKGEQCYTILLILTDGAVSDVQSTAACLNQISGAPLSVVIVGIGHADFSSMQFLDDASAPGKRDIAQFVEFHKHSLSGVDLTTATLQEIPEQLVGYFQSHGIPPLPPIERSDEEIVVEPEEEEIDLSLDFDDDGEIHVAAGGTNFNDSFATGFVSH